MAACSSRRRERPSRTRSKPAGCRARVRGGRTRQWCASLGAARRSPRSGRASHRDATRQASAGGLRYQEDLRARAGRRDAQGIRDYPVALAAELSSFYPNETQLSWLDGHNHALSFLGGVPLTLRIDNLKTGVEKGAGAWAELNGTHGAYVDKLGFTSTRPGRAARRIRARWSGACRISLVAWCARASAS